MRRLCRQRHGFLMVELLLVIIVLSIFGLISSRLFVSVMKLNYNASLTHTRTVRFDAAVRMLRDDCWSAGEITVDGGTLVVKDRGGKAVSWSIEKDGTISRSGDGARLRWAAETQGATFELRDGTPLLKIPETVKTRSAEIVLVNQQRAGGGRSS